jgi:AraC-like DNA-binding protein
LICALAVCEAQFNGVTSSSAYICAEHSIDCAVLAEWESLEVTVINSNSSILRSAPLSFERTGDQSAPDAIGIAGRDALPATDISPRDHIIKSLCCALNAVELEHDEHCAEALRRAIEARLAGLRPVTRAADCGGDADTNKPQVRALQKWRLKRVAEYVDTNLSNKISLLDLAAVAGLSRMHFACQFRAATGLRPHEFLLRRRIWRSKELMKGTSMTIAEIALTVGFLTQAHFTTVFKRFVGYTPRQWRTANQMPSAPRTRDAIGSETTTAL